jgi:hypothetical protein
MKIIMIANQKGDVGSVILNMPKVAPVLAY